jgi:hypothetical protein
MLKATLTGKQLRVDSEAMLLSATYDLDGEPGAEREAADDVLAAHQLRRNGDWIDAGDEATAPVDRLPPPPPDFGG